jgi:aminoglycoside phosphotransferase (APT) family kinase protein
MVSLDACLPAELRAATTAITPIAAGLSGAGVYRVDAGGEAFVLKVAAADEPLDAWRRRVDIQLLAAGAGLTPRVIHVDAARRAILSAFVVDRSFVAFYGDPRTRDAALERLGRMVRRVHGLPRPADAPSNDSRDFLATTWADIGTNFKVPPFVGDAVGRMLGEAPPDRDRALVLSHNDINPTNLVFDGENLMLLDWDTAGLNDPLYDLAVIAVFLRMDDGTCARLLAAYDGAPVTGIPARFIYHRRLAAVLCGAIFLRLSRDRGHAGSTGTETLDSTPSLAEFYQRLRSGSSSIATADGQWQFGLALVKASAGPIRD